MCATGASQKRVPGVETVSGGKQTAGRKFAMLQAVLQPGMSDNPATFEEMWKSWEHQVDFYENRSSSTLDDDVKISLVLRETHGNSETICW